MAPARADARLVRARPSTTTGARDAFGNSLKAGLAATAVALVLGTLASLAVARHRFFGRETISFLVILPIALPGIVTGIALNATFTQFLGIDLSLFTIVVGHATFCIVVVYNNVLARLRRIAGIVRGGLGRPRRHTWQTFRHITLPNMRTALVAGALLAFALSFDEIIVTTFTVGTGEQTLPIWIFSNLFRPNNVPIVNVVALIAGPDLDRPDLPGPPPDPRGGPGGGSGAGAPRARRRRAP